jgi:hypothetical protein
VSRWGSSTLPAGDGALNRTDDAAEASPEAESGAGVGVGAGVFEAVFEGVDAAKPSVAFGFRVSCPLVRDTVE